MTGAAHRPTDAPRATGYSSRLTDEELAAAVAAVGALRRRRGSRVQVGSRWARAGRIAAVEQTEAAVVPALPTWAAAERPQ